jgi:hypothetical protein
MFFEDGSVRAIDLAPYVKVDPAAGGPVNTGAVALQAGGQSVIWKDGSRFSADFLSANSLLIGRWERHVQNWRRSVPFDKAEVRIEVGAKGMDSYLLLDGKRYPALLISGGWFGIHENTAWYDVPFPGDGEDGEEGLPEWEELPVVWDTLKELVEMVNRAVEKGESATFDVTDLLRKSGRSLCVGWLSPRSAAIRARRFKKSPPDERAAKSKRS